MPHPHYDSDGNRLESDIASDCPTCQGAGGVCTHPARVQYDDCPDGHADCDSCELALECDDCGGTGII